MRERATIARLLAAEALEKASVADTRRVGRLAMWSLVVAAAALLVASPSDSSHGTLAREPITVPAGTAGYRDEVKLEASIRLSSAAPIRVDHPANKSATNTRTSGDNPAWSPDGRRIAFLSLNVEDFDFEIYVMNANGSGQRRLTRVSGFDTAPSWSPDGRRVGVPERPGPQLRGARDERGREWAAAADTRAGIRRLACLVTRRPAHRLPERTRGQL
jgi:hypothetical protein